MTPSRIGAPLDPRECPVFLRGNPDMIGDVQAILQERGFKTHTRPSPGNIHMERYWQATDGRARIRGLALSPTPARIRPDL